MKRESQLDLFQNFTEKEDQRTKISIGGQVEAMLDYCEYVIHSEYDKKSKTKYKFKERKKQVSQDFMRAYSTLQRQDKINYYIKNVIYLIRISNGNTKPPKLRTDTMEANVHTLSYNIKRWKQKKIRLDNTRQILFGEKKNTIKQYDLGDYIFRGSKNSKYYTFVLEAIKETVYAKQKTVHIGFDSAEQMKEWADAIQVCIDYKHWQRIYIQLYKKQPPRETMQNISTPLGLIDKQRMQSSPALITLSVPLSSSQMGMKKQIKTNQKQSISSDQFQSDSGSDKGNQDKVQRTIIEDLVQGQAMNLQNLQSIQQRNIKQKRDKSMENLNIFHRMFPQFQFSDVQYEGNYQMIHNDSTIRIMQHTEQKQKFKIVIEIQSEQLDLPQCIFKALCSPDFSKNYNDNIQQFQVKTLISSQNAAIMYMVLKAFNRIYRPRDFIFIRHAFKIGSNSLYIADKSIENVNYPPFITVVRGKYECIWSILRKQKNKVKVVACMNIDNTGYLNDNQNTNLSLNYMKNFSKLNLFVRSNIPKLKEFVMFDLGWDITKNNQNSIDETIRVKRKSNMALINQKRKSQVSYAVKQPFVQNVKNKPNQQIQRKQNIIMVEKQKQLNIEREKMNSEQVVAEVDPEAVLQEKLQTNKQIKLTFDQKGMVVIPKGHLKNRYQITPLKSYPNIYWASSNPAKHPIWNDEDWKHDTKKGGLLFINQKKIDDQKGVIKFILSKVGKNLLSGKSILNISLPVDIFVAKSNLELFIQSLCYAPVLLQKARSLDPFEKFKIVAAFGISMSPLYLIMEKPFNPIIGETFQAWINGCPGYAQQISHHPPICSLLFYGRGYTISGQFQSKAEVHVNSGTGTNDGIFRVNFDDGTKYCFCSAGGQVSGLAYGDRKFNIQGKAYCWSETQNIFSQIVFNPARKGFFSMKKQQQPQDYFEGQLVKVPKEFIYSLRQKRRSVTPKQTLQSFGKLNGIWHQQLSYQNQQLLNYEKQLPFKLEYQKHPLPSDSNWREDIAYRRLMEVPRAQIQKQRLENFQRNDRKLREKKK